MWSPETIRDMEDEAAQKAAAKAMVPYVPFDEEEVDRYPPFPFPNLGSHRPDGWELGDEHLVDSSGWGTSGELAHTPEQFKKVIKERPGKGWAIISQGQFQVVVGEFEKNS